MNRLRGFLQSKTYRRKYREVYSHKLVRKAAVLKNSDFDYPERYDGTFIASNDSIQKLLACKKSGVWLKSRYRLSQTYRWRSNYIQYFSEIPLYDNSQIIVGNFLVRVTLVELRNVTCAPYKNASRNLNKYAMRIQHFRHKPTNLIKEGFFAVAAGGDSFQHFLQDLAPILAFYNEFLNSNPELPIILLKPLPSFVSFDLLISRMGIRNRLILVDPNEDINVERLCIPIFSPRNALYATPVVMYRTLKTIIDQGAQYPINDSKPLVLLVERHEKTRNVSNFDDLRENIELWSHSRFYTFDTVDPRKEPPERVIQKFQQAKVVIAFHGGANYNIIFSKRKSLLIEFVPTINTNSLAEFSLAIGIDYLPIPVNGTISSPHFTVPIQKVLEALDSR